MKIQRYYSLREDIDFIQQQHDHNCSVKLLAVTKKVPLEMIRLLHEETGHVDFGENNIVELEEKAQVLKDCDLNWHFIGPLQSNKIKSICRNASWVQSLSKKKHADHINRHAEYYEKQMQVLLQYNISSEPQKNGVCSFEELMELAEHVSKLPHITLRGLSGMASKTASTHMIQAQFNFASDCFKALKEKYISIDTLSLGMSGDYPIAIECGSNMVRVGSFLFSESSISNHHRRAA